MLLSELQKQKKTKNIKCRIKKKKKKARRVFVKFMVKYIAAKFGDCNNFLYSYPPIDWCTFKSNGKYYHINIFHCFETFVSNENSMYKSADIFISDRERIKFMEFAHRVYHLYTKTDYLDLRRRAITLLLCNLRNKEFPKGVDKIIAQKITIF